MSATARHHTPAIRLEDIEYFSKKKQQDPAVFELAQRVFDASSKEPNNAKELERRLNELSRTQGAEHWRQSANLMAELVVFDELAKQGVAPRWIPESARKGIKTPDIEYTKGGLRTPVEVKHLNDPKDEHEATYAGRSIGGSVDRDYKTFLGVKVKYLVDDATAKFSSYYSQPGSDSTSGPTLYLFYTKSINADIADIVENTLAQFDNQHAKSMTDHIIDIAQPLIEKGTTLIVRELRNSTQ